MMELKRLPKWRGPYSDLIDRIRARPFDWTSQYDCLMGLAIEAVRAITGHDFGAPYRGKYETPIGAYQLMRRAGFTDLGDAIASQLPEVPVHRARIGDIVTLANPDDVIFSYALGVVNGERIFVLREDGLGTRDLLEAERAFAVG